MGLFDKIPPVVNGPIPKDARCQEASIFSRESYIPCGAPAVAVIRHKRERDYYMCLGCADHNLRNRGATLVRQRKGTGLKQRAAG